MWTRAPTGLNTCDSYQAHPVSARVHIKRSAPFAFAAGPIPRQLKSTMIDLIKKSLLAGVGAAVFTKDKVETALEQFVRDGKVSTADARIMAEKIAEQGRKEFDEFCAHLAAKVRDSAGRADESSQLRLTALEQRVRVLEEKLAPPTTRAGEP